MRKDPPFHSFACSILWLTLAAAVGCGGESRFLVEPLSEGIFLFRPTEAGSGHTNALVAERDDGLLVIDSQPTPSAARDLLDAIDARFDAEIRYLILSSPHAEAAGGASAFAETTTVIASADSVAALADPGYDFGAEERARSAEPESWSAPPRRLPDLGLRAHTDLPDSRVPATVRVHARSHSVGNLTVYFPEANLLYVGALIAPDRNPYAGDAHIGRWIGLLNTLIYDGTGILVGLDGPATDLREAEALRDGFAWLRGRVEAGFIDRLEPEQIERNVLDLPGTAERFATDDVVTFVPGLVRQVVAEAVIQRKKRGLL